MRLNCNTPYSNPFLFINRAIAEKEERIKIRCGNLLDYYDYDAGIYRNVTSEYVYIDTAWADTMHYENYDDSHRL